MFSQYPSVFFLNISRTDFKDKRKHILQATRTHSIKSPKKTGTRTPASACNIISVLILFLSILDLWEYRHCTIYTNFSASTKLFNCNSIYASLKTGITCRRLPRDARPIYNSHAKCRPQAICSAISSSQPTYGHRRCWFTESTHTCLLYTSDAADE